MKSLLKRSLRRLRGGRGHRGEGPRVDPARQSLCVAHGERVLALFREFVAGQGRLNEQAWARVEHNIRNPSPVLRYYSDVLDTFMPDYPSRLMERYRMQQYEMMHTFLQYPFYPHYIHIDKRLFPYEDASSHLDGVDILDYGSGLAHGLIWLLVRSPDVVRSVTLVDLGFIYLEFTIFACQRLAPNVPIRVHRLADTDEVPRLEGPHNLIVASDVMEHLKDPVPAMQSILSSAAVGARCYFDLELHEAWGQHVTPDTRFLRDIVEQSGFTLTEKVLDLSVYTRQAAGGGQP